ncbi:MAG: hypothetical protein IME99_06770 [Proteobacteria bacterium]|nr:hypothetical protein [Pseudomonadota bacterium]
MTPSEKTKKRPTAPKPFKKLYGTSFIEEYGRIESSRSARFSTSYSLLTIELEGVDLGAQSSASADDDAASKAKRFISSTLGALRDCDIVALTKKNRLVVLLPQTDCFGAFVLVRKLRKGAESFSKKYPDVTAHYTHSTFGVDGRDYLELYKRTEERAEEQKRSLWNSLGLEKRLFWETIGALFAEPHTGNYNANFDAGQEYELSEFFMDRVNELIIKEVKRSPRRRGILYFSTGKITANMPILKAIADLGMTKTKIFLSGEQEGEEVSIGNTLPIYLDDPRLKETFFTLFLNEDFGYALLARETWGASYTCFHTSDPFLVEGLINKFQHEYSLQEQL